LYNDDLVLAYDFNAGIEKPYGKIKDLSTYGHDATVKGTPTFMRDCEETSTGDAYMTINGYYDML